MFQHKACYHSKYIHHAVDCYKANVTPSQIYELDQLDAMQLAHTVWKDVDTTTIWNCWHKAGILPDALFPSSSSLPPTILISSLISVEMLKTVLKTLFLRLKGSWPMLWTISKQLGHSSHQIR
jgi:hypothetical protein